MVRQVIESNINSLPARSALTVGRVKKIIDCGAIAAESDKFEDLDHRSYIIKPATQMGTHQTSC